MACQLTTSNVPEDSFTVQWTFDSSSEIIDVMSYDGRKKVEIQDKRYQGRTELFHSELRKGNMSLNLKKSQLSDQGQYTCMISLGDWYDQAVVQLIMIETPAGTFSISSYIIVQPGVDSEISCKIISSALQLESESRILISEQDCLKFEIGVADFQSRSGRALDELAALTLDPDCKHPGLNISVDKKRAAFNSQVAQPGFFAIVAKESYAFGKHYWEVKVDGRVNWELGVLTQAQRDKAKTEKFEKPLGEENYSLKSLGGDLFSNQNKIEKKQVLYAQIGMLLDQEEQKITFYNAEVMFLITSTPIPENEKLYPFLSFEKADEICKEKPLEIIHIVAPIPLKISEKNKGGKLRGNVSEFTKKVMRRGKE
uniref:Uncharacterized protein n=1 Tax=Sphaerodactylus townsendi TaxID=933632 RepID=A0ACB8EVR5_9SAUR